MKLRTMLLEIIFIPFVFLKYRRKVGKEELVAKLQYPQGWYFVPQNKIFKRIIQWLCNLMGGHEVSETEWGYGGGEYADRWCRWCNKRIKVPKTSLYFSQPHAKDLMKKVGMEEGINDQAQALLAVAHMKIVKKTCHFCRERTTRTFIKAGNKKHPVYICEECVAFCAMIILAEQKKNATKTERKAIERQSVISEA